MHKKYFVGAVVASAGLVVIGLLPVPYGFYGLLRLVLFVTSLYGGFLMLNRNPGLVVGSGISALLYNPIIPIHLGSKLIWVVLNIGALVLFVTINSQLGDATQAQDE